MYRHYFTTTLSQTLASYIQANEPLSPPNPLRPSKAHKNKTQQQQQQKQFFFLNKQNQETKNNNKTTTTPATTITTTTTTTTNLCPTPSPLSLFKTYFLLCLIFSAACFITWISNVQSTSEGLLRTIGVPKKKSFFFFFFFFFPFVLQ